MSEQINWSKTFVFTNKMEADETASINILS